MPALFFPSRPANIYGELPDGLLMFKTEPAGIVTSEALTPLISSVTFPMYSAIFSSATVSAKVIVSPSARVLPSTVSPFKSLIKSASSTLKSVANAGAVLPATSNTDNKHTLFR